MCFVSQRFLSAKLETFEKHGVYIKSSQKPKWIPVFFFGFVFLVFFHSSPKTHTHTPERLIEYRYFNATKKLKQNQTKNSGFFPQTFWGFFRTCKIGSSWLICTNGILWIKIAFGWAARVKINRCVPAIFLAPIFWNASPSIVKLVSSKIGESSLELAEETGIVLFATKSCIIGYLNTAAAIRKNLSFFFFFFLEEPNFFVWFFGTV